MSNRPLKIAVTVILAFAVLYGGLLSLPFLLSLKVQYDETRVRRQMTEQFPVTVDLRSKRIVEDVRVNAYLASADSPLSAATVNAGSVLWDILGWTLGALVATPIYQSLAAVDSRVVTIYPGMRREQVANAFSAALSWTSIEKQKFLNEPSSATSTLPLTLFEGIFSPGTYLVSRSASPADARAVVDERFNKEVLSRYGAAVAEAVPLDQAITIASLIQREAGGSSDMRIISGIIWNRLFSNMRLQIDATVQYARANKQAVGGSWWPVARPADLRIKSPYNTYQQVGLPPGPISNASVAAILAALNPVRTDCLFYFHDNLGGFHCSATYKGHVVLLKQYYGRGK